MKLEVVVLPVADAQRSKDFYESLGWRLDAGFVNSETSRILQFTPTGSDASIIFGTGVTTATSGSVSERRLPRRRLGRRHRRARRRVARAAEYLVAEQTGEALPV